MKTGAALALICVGAILAFAVTATPSFFNLHTAGWVIMLIGLVGLLLPGRTYSWIGQRLQVRRTYPGRRVVPTYVQRDQDTAPLRPGLPARPAFLDDEDPVAPAEDPRYPAAYAQDPSIPRHTEVVEEDVYEEP